VSGPERAADWTIEKKRPAIDCDRAAAFLFVPPDALSD